MEKIKLHENKIWCRNKNNAYGNPSITREKPKKRLGNYNQVGENSNGSKLTEEDVLNIIALRKAGMTLKDISNKVNASIGNIGNIIKGRSWKHIKRD